MSSVETPDNKLETNIESKEQNQQLINDKLTILELKTDVCIAKPDLTSQINSKRKDSNDTSGNKANNFGNMHSSKRGNPIGTYTTQRNETLNVYPTRKDGLNATKQLLKDGYYNLTLEGVAKKWIGQNSDLARQIIEEENMEISDTLSDNNIEIFLIALGRREGNLRKGQTLEERINEGKSYSLNETSSNNTTTSSTEATSTSSTEATSTSSTEATSSTEVIPTSSTEATSTSSTEATSTSSQERIRYMKDIASDLLNKYKKLKKNIKPTEGSAKTKTEFKHQLNENIQNLNKIINDLNNYSYQNLSKYESRLGELTLWFEHYEQVRQMIVLGERTSNIHTIIDSKSDAKHAKNYAEKYAKYQQEINSILHDTAITSLWNDDMNNYEDYLKLVINGQIEPSTHPFFTKHQQSLSFIKSVNPSLYSILVPNGNVTHEGKIIQAPISQTTIPQTIEYTKKQTTDYSNLDRGECFEKGGLSGLIGKSLSCCNNMTPGQRNTWQTLGTLGMIGGLLYGGYKFITSKKIGWRGKAGIVAGTILGSQVMTGENPISLISKLLHGGLSWNEIQDKFGNALGEIGTSSNPEIAATAVPLVIPVIFGNNIKVSDINQMSQQFKNYPQAWSEFYRATYQKLQSDGLKEYWKNNFNESSFNETNRNTFLSNAGINEYTDGNISVHELAETANKNDAIINGFRCRHGLKITKDENKSNEYKNFVKMKKGKNELITEEELLQGWNEKGRFEVDDELTHTEREEDKQNIQKLTQKIEELSISNDETKKNLIAAFTEFYNNKSIKNKPIVDTIILSYNPNSNILTFISNQNNSGTKIDIANMGIKGFTESNTVRFNNLAEAISAAHLTNHILSCAKGNMPVNTNKIFSHDTMRKGIYFNDSNILERNIDTRVLSTGRGGASSEFKSIHDKNLGEYAKYLSNRRKEIHKIELNETDYPILSNIGIEFYSQEEAKGVENLLKSIINELGTDRGTEDGQPFSIEGNNLYFKHLDDHKRNFGSVDTFISIKSNQSKFLQYINTPDNKIFGKDL